MKALHRRSVFHDGTLITFAVLAGLVEGPAQVGCGVVLLLAAASGRWAGYRPGVFAIAVSVWVVAGYVAGGDWAARSTGEITRPFMAWAAVVGARSLARASPRRLGHVAWAFGSAITLNAAYGVLQLAVGAPPWEAGLLANLSDPSRLGSPPEFAHRMALGLFDHRLRLAEIGVVGLALASVVVTAPEVSRRTRAAAGLSLAVLVPAVLGTYVRMPWVGFVAGAVALWALLGRPWTALAAAGGGICVAIGLLSTPIGARRIASGPEDWAVRTRMWSAGIEVFRDHPWFGVGHGGYRAAVEGMPGLTGVQLTSPHNLAIQALAETGVVGAGALAVALGVTLWRLGRAVRAHRRDDGGLVRLERVAFLGLGALMVTGLVHFTLHHAAVGLVFWTLAGVAHRR